MSATQPLAILRELREAAGLSQADAARRVGLTGRQSRLTLGAWENGTFPADEKRRRTALIDYLWDVLRLRRDPVRFSEVWEVLEEAWGWEPLSDSEWRRLNQPPPAPITAAPPPFQAPASIAHFVGRVAELDELAQRLQQPASRVALVGMGGVGKTSLAIEAAHRLRPHFPDGVLWADAAASDPLDILQSWAAAFGRDYSGLRDVASRAAAVRSLLAGKKVLLVLDDVRVAEQVEPLFPGDPVNSIIMTTRSGDAAAAIHTSIVPLAEWSQKESRELLVAVLGSGRVQQESEAAGELCSLVHHLPLAVEIAAQFLAVRTRQRLADMVRRLRQAQNRLDLRISSRDVRTSFAVSWGALDEGHRQLFAALAVFEGRSFAGEAAAAVAGLDEATTQERLENLKALSLVAEAEDERYRQHPLLADFAAEQLGDRAPFYGRLANYFVRAAHEDRANPGRLALEWEQTAAVISHLYGLQLWSNVVELVEALKHPWEAAGKYQLARHGYALSVDALRRSTDLPRLAQHLVRWGYMCIEQNDYAEAERLLHEGLQLAQQETLLSSVADAQYHLVRIYLERAEYEDAAQLIADCRQIREEKGDKNGIAAAIQNEATISYRVGDYAHAARLCETALALQEEVNDIPGVIMTLRWLTDIEIERRDFQLAEEYARRALTLAQTIQHQSELAEIEYLLAVIYRFLEQFEDALALLERSRITLERTGNRTFLALVWYETFVIQKLQGRYNDALAAADTALCLVEAMDDHYNHVNTLFHLGDLHMRMGQIAAARAAWLHGQEIAHRIHHPRHPQFGPYLAAIDAVAINENSPRLDPQLSSR